MRFIQFITLQLGNPHGIKDKDFFLENEKYYISLVLAGDKPIQTGESKHQWD